ncbi:MAG: cache domain-containing protein [Thermoanaerobaculia bacterium]|nr:cache domain-containing protein [Thermoanaerobaculia bacterium]
MISRRWILVLCFVAVACVRSYTPRSNTRADLQRYVERAAAVVREKGAASCETFSQQAWMGGDYYIFVNELDTNLMVCHAMRPELIGQSQANLQDANGKFIARDMQTAVSAPSGSGWVEYVWPRPGQTNAIAKSSYVMSVTGPDGKRYIVGSGGYEMPR